MALRSHDEESPLTGTTRASWRQWLAERLVPNELFGEDPERLRRARLVLSFTLLAAVAAVALGLFQVFFGSYWIALVALAGAVFAGSAVLVLRVTRSEVLAANMLCLLVTVALTVVVAIRGGLGQPIGMSYAVVPMLALLLGSRRSGAVWLAVSLAALVGMAAIVIAYGPLPGVELSSPLELNLLGHLVFVAALYLVAATYEFLRRRAKAESEAAQRRLLEAERRRIESEAEAQLLRSSRMAELGTLAAGVAHEINNPLTAVEANLRTLLDNPRSGHAVDERRALEESLDAAGRIARIVRDIRLFSRVEPEEAPEPVDVHEVIDSSVRLLSNQIRHRATLRRDCDDVPRVLGSASRLGQVFVNILRNAVQAIPEDRHGRIDVTTRRGESGHVLVSIADDGVGMSRELQRRAPEPFFTTKPVGEGTGLGLSICYGIVTAMGGEVRIESSPGLGTKVEVELVAAEPARTPSPDPDEAGAAASPRLRLLVIDDDALVLRSIERLLRGHDVTAVGSAAQALELLGAGETFDALLCDLMMPDVSGMELYEEARRLDPALGERFVFMTGGAFTEGARRFVDEVAAPTLDKPVTREALEASLRAAAARASAREA